MWNVRNFQTRVVMSAINIFQRRSILSGIDEVNRPASNISDQNTVNKLSDYKCVKVPKHGWNYWLRMSWVYSVYIDVANGAQIPIVEIVLNARQGRIQYSIGQLVVWSCEVRYWGDGVCWFGFCVHLPCGTTMCVGGSIGFRCGRMFTSAMKLDSLSRVY